MQPNTVMLYITSRYSLQTNVQCLCSCPTSRVRNSYPRAVHALQNVSCDDAAPGKIVYDRDLRRDAKPLSVTLRYSMQGAVPCLCSCTSSHFSAPLLVLLARDDFTPP